MDYFGFVFIGLIKVKDEPMVIEYNVRMGDPETEVVFPRINNDVIELFDSMGTSNFNLINLDIKPDHAATIILVSGGYPQEYEKEKPIKAILKNEFIKKTNFTRFVKSNINTTKNGKIEIRILKGQESYKIKSFVKSNIWAVFPSGKSIFKKNEIVDCFFPNHPNKILS